MLFLEPRIAESMHPEMVRFWRWYAVEELEHKAVAFDLFREMGGGYLLRVFSATAALVLLALPFHRIVRRMMRDDPTIITPAMRQRAREFNRRVMGPQLRMIAQYFRPGFHPWDFEDEPHLKQWYASSEARRLRPAGD